MKRLLVMRHAKTEADSVTGRDFDRRLTGRGHEDAAAIGAAMRARGLKLDEIIASPAQRVVQTLAALADGYGTLAAGYDRRIYNAPFETLIEVIHEAGTAAQTLLLVGHNPGVHLLVLALTGPNGDARIADGFPTATLAIVDLAVADWADVAPGCGALADVILR